MFSQRKSRPTTRPPPVPVPENEQASEADMLRASRQRSPRSRSPLTAAQRRQRAQTARRPGKLVGERSEQPVQTSRRHSTTANQSGGSRWKVSSFWTAPWSAKQEAPDAVDEKTAPEDGEGFSDLMDRLSSSKYFSIAEETNAQIESSPTFVTHLLKERDSNKRLSGRKLNQPRQSEDTRQMLQKSLRSHFLFADLARDTIDEVISGMQRIEVMPGDVIMKQGEVGNMFYAVEKGVFDVYVNEKLQSSVTTGGCFGELALLSPDGLRKATVMCRQGTRPHSSSEPSLASSVDLITAHTEQQTELDKALMATDGSPNILWAIAGVHFRAALALNRVKELEHRRNALGQVEFFTQLTSNQLNLLAQAVVSEYYEAGTRIIEKGTEGFDMFVLMRGTVVCHGFNSGAGDTVPAFSTSNGDGDVSKADSKNLSENNSLRVARKRLSGNVSTLELFPGAAFGEQALLYNEYRAAHVDAGAEGADVLRVSVAVFNDLLGPLREVLERNLRLKVLSEVRVFSNLAIEARQALASKMEHVILKDGDKLFTAGETADAAYIIRWGSINLERATQVKGWQRSKLQIETRTKGMCIGEEALMGIPKYLDDAVCVASTARRKSIPRVSANGQNRGQEEIKSGPEVTDIVELYRIGISAIREAGFGYTTAQHKKEHSTMTLRRLFSGMKAEDEEEAADFLRSLPCMPKLSPRKSKSNSSPKVDEQITVSDVVDFNVDVSLVHGNNTPKVTVQSRPPSLTAAIPEIRLNSSSSDLVKSSEEAAMAIEMFPDPISLKYGRSRGDSVSSPEKTLPLQKRRWARDQVRPPLQLMTLHSRRASTTVQIQSRRRTLQEGIALQAQPFACDDADGLVASGPPLSLTSILGMGSAWRHTLYDMSPYMVMSNPLGEGKKCVEDFDLIRVLGIGSFGVVKLAKHKQTNHVVALKLISKSYVAMTRQHAYVAEERKLLLALRHPMIVRLYDTFQDKNLLYMVMEVAQGGEMFRLMHGDGSEEILMDPEAVKFYATCILSVYSYVHDRNIVYRDLKPENILLDTQGYLKIGDWGIAKRLGGHKLGVTFTMVGTPEYLAPETVKGVGHGIPVDYWALGCIVYEMLAGYSPFAGNNVEDTVQVCANVVEGEIEFNNEENNFDKLSEDFVRRLLNRDPIRRLGRGHDGAGEAFSHPWLEGYNAQLVQKRILQPPWVPEIVDETDASCFEDYGDEDMDPSMLVYSGPDGPELGWADF